MAAYLEQMIEDFIMFGSGSYEATALGFAAAKSLNSSYGILQEDFPIDVTTRNLASNFNQNSLTCQTFIDPYVDGVTAAIICSTYNFHNVTQLMPFVEGMWYGGEYLTALQTETGMDQTQTDAFYNTADPNSFGTALLNECSTISTMYGCANATNCTNNELALL
jgi:hypothetical protein